MRQDRYEGALLGLAVGDALGTTVEFMSPGSFEPMTDMVGGGVFDLAAGQWTDDTSMALCLGYSLVAKSEFDAEDQMRRYLDWFRNGALSSTGVCFDIGNATREALLRFEQTGEPYCGSENPYSAGNGSIMRLAPVAMRYASHLPKAIDYAERSSRTTHGTAECIGACGVLAAMLVTALSGGDKQQVLDVSVSSFAAHRSLEALSTELQAVTLGSYKIKQPPDIVGSGYVVRSLEAALWAFYHSNSFAEGALLAVNLGDDADTTGAIYGQLAGAFYGASGIPEHWRDRLYMGEQIRELAHGLYQLSKQDEE